ncbi:hypothetical protein COLO4_05398 [Corchorus olitorius]|uniref:Retrotransposon gag protein n=1 Tax=Corchorus olitorius TaxID=93759 RepID=A0A1R3KR00_9ROSI|nr:hypothetical protein COLO4_05398 [Corchorus olitorius]
MAPKVDRSDTSITEALHALTETFNTQFQELRASQIELKQSLDTKLDLAIADFNKKLAIRESPSSSSLPSHKYDGVLGTFPGLTPPNTTNPLFKPKTPKFFLSSFDGTNVHAWLFQAEQYFKFYSITHEQRVPMVHFFMTGEAAAWYQWMYKNNQLSDWESSRAIEICFGPSKFLNPQSALFKLRQTGTEVITFKPITLAHAFELAKHIESKLFESRQTPSRAPPRAFQTPVQKPIPPTSYPIRRLSPTKMQARHSKGLCFNCDEQFKPGHRYKTTLFLLLQTEDDFYDPLISLETSKTTDCLPLSSLPLPPPPKMPLIPEEKTPDFQVSLHTLHGIASHSCLKLTGVIHGHSSTILIDSGSTHNLVQPRVVRHLGLAVEPAPPLTVRVWNGDVLRCAGKISMLKVDLQNMVFSLYLFLLDIHGADSIGHPMVGPTRLNLC